MLRRSHQLLRQSGYGLPRRACAAALSSSADAAAPSNVLVTTPIFYVNAAPHIGHLYSSLLADALARWHRIQGRDVVFSTGTDEHGIKVQEAADAKGVAPAQFCDDVSAQFREAFDGFDIQYDDYVRTTEERHLETVNHLWRTLKDRGFIYLGEHTGWYDRPHGVPFTILHNIHRLLPAPAGTASPTKRP